VLQTLFHIPSHLFGVPLFGFGLLLAVWALASAALLAWLVRRQGWNADTRGYVPLLLVIGAAIWLILPKLCDAQGLPIRGYGMMLLLAVAAGVSLAVWRARRAGIDPDLIYNLTFWMFVPGLIGARAFYVIQKWPTEFEPIFQSQGLWAVLGQVVNVAMGGLVVYGSLIGAVVGVAAFLYKYRLPPLAMLDLITPSLLLGLALGRLGCLLNGCCYGGDCSLPWAITFPAKSPVHVHQFHDGEVDLYGVKLADPPYQAPLITEIEPGSPAEKAGLAAGWAIDAVDERPTDTAQEAYDALVDAGEAGRPAALLTVRVQVQRWTQEGATVSPATPLHGLKIPGDDRQPPVVAEVAPESLAAKQGLRAGEEIYAIDGRRVRTAPEARQMLARPAAPWSVATVVDHASGTLAIAAAPGRSNPVHPTQIYSAINAVLLCLFLLAYDPFRRRDGELWALFLTIYPITRFLLEVIRTDEPAVFGTGLSISQNVSIMLLVCAAALWVSILLKPPGTAFARYEEPAKA